MRIDQAKNQADTTALMAEKDIVIHAFRRGIYDFYNGKRISHTFTPLQKVEVHRRAMALKSGKDGIAAKYTDKLLEQHIILEDKYEGDSLIETKGFLTTVADNPYRRNTLYSKEWERGFNTAFFRNQPKKIKLKLAA